MKDLGVHDVLESVKLAMDRDNTVRSVVRVYNEETNQDAELNVWFVERILTLYGGLDK
jgi:hypothetical protein